MPLANPARNPGQKSRDTPPKDRRGTCGEKRKGNASSGKGGAERLTYNTQRKGCGNWKKDTIRRKLSTGYKTRGKKETTDGGVRRRPRRERVDTEKIQKRGPNVLSKNPYDVEPHRPIIHGPNQKNPTRHEDEQTGRLRRQLLMAGSCRTDKHEGWDDNG